MKLLDIIKTSLPIIYKNNKNKFSFQIIFNKVKQSSDGVTLIKEDEPYLISSVLTIRDLSTNFYNIESKNNERILTISNVDGYFLLNN